ncbi:MAG: zf-HC2 domain-containing protein [Actinomycetota bacterium]
MHGNCDRARHWVSADVDGELSTFERVLLANHLTGCPACREFRASVRGLTKTIRSAPRERFEVILIGRLRRRARLRLAPAVAAMAVAAVGLGSILASSEVRTRSIARAQSASPGIDTINLSINTALASQRTAKAVRFPTSARRSLRGGPVLHEQ